MKQLLLNFLFFVGSAFILVQCAKLFPTVDKLSKRLTQSHTYSDNTIHNKQNKGAFAIAGAAKPNPGVKTPFFNNASLPYNMMVYINDHSLFYNPYINFNYYDLVRKYQSKSRHDK
jgi:hypothetical protein